MKQLVYWRFTGSTESIWWCLHSKNMYILMILSSATVVFKWLVSPHSIPRSMSTVTLIFLMIKLLIGNDDDLEIYHNGTNGVIGDVGKEIKSSD